MTTRRDSPVRYRPSLLARLVDPAASSAAEAALPEQIRAEQDIGGIRKQLILDLADLFRAKATRPLHPDTESFVQRSIRFYGLPDLSTISLESEPKQGKGWQNLRRLIAKCIETFEPRMSRVVVRLDPPAEALDRGMIRLHISAQLRLDPREERVEFDAELPLTVDCLLLPEAEQTSSERGP